MSEVQQRINGTVKAGNYKSIAGKVTVIDWERKTILHNYSVQLLDSEGDLITEEGSGNVLLEPSAFDLWINQTMKDATLSAILSQYEESENA